MPQEGEKQSLKDARTWEVLQVLMGVLLAIVTALSAWTGTTLVSHGQRLSTIEANRHTTEDALELNKATAKEFLAVWQEIATVRGEASKAPDEVIRWLERIERRVDKLENGG